MDDVEVSRDMTCQELLAVLESTPIPTFAIDRHHRIILWNRAMAGFSRVSASTVLGTNRHRTFFFESERPCMADLLVDAPTDPQPSITRWFGDSWRTVPQPPGGFEATHFFPSWQGEQARWIRFTAALVRDSSGAITGAVESCEDVTARITAEEALRHSEERYRTLVENSSDGILLLDVQRNILSCNQGLLTTFGFSDRNEVIGKPTRILHPSEDSFAAYGEQFYPLLNAKNSLRTQWDLCRRDGTLIPAEMSTSVVRASDGQVVNYVVVIRDIADRRRQEEKLSYLATHDSLTGLPNRILFMNHLHLEIHRAARGGHGVAILFLDVDNFKAVNDAYGHAVGDQVLCAVAERLTDLARRSDALARIGGDEFVMMLPDLARVDDALSVAEKLVEAFRRPMRIGSLGIQVSLSVGVAVYPEDAEQTESLLKNADAAMYKVKASGRNGFQRYSAH